GIHPPPPCTSLRLSLPFVLVALPPPRSPLFPYTTLFRSRADGPHRGPDRPAGARQRLLGPLPEPRGDASARRAAPGRHPQQGLQDRKSTRLNSSHVKISYAVFCLKKKRQRHIARRVAQCS